VDARQDLAELTRDQRPRRGVGRIAQKLASDRRAADAAHDEAVAQAVFGLSSNSTSGARTPALKAAASTRNSVARSSAVLERGLLALPVRRRIAAQDQAVALAVHDASKLQVWREAPPDSRLSRSIVGGSPKCRPAAPARPRRPGRLQRLCERSFTGLWHRPGSVVRGRAPNGGEAQKCRTDFRPCTAFISKTSRSACRRCSARR
jgi:hypothetical protein